MDLFEKWLVNRIDEFNSKLKSDSTSTTDRIICESFKEFALTVTIAYRVLDGEIENWLMGRIEEINRRLDQDIEPIDRIVCESFKEFGLVSAAALRAFRQQEKSGNSR